MHKLKVYFWRTIKAIGWVVISFVLLFTLIVVLIRLPAVQTRIVHYATTYVSNKTHTKVEIKRVNVSFPKSVVLEGLYLEDQKKDTLLYAGKAVVDIALYGLIKNKIAVSSFELNEVVLNLNRPSADSLFNYSFLTTAFGDTANQVKKNPSATSKWRYSIGQVSLNSIRIHYRDEHGGMVASATFKNMELKIGAIDPEKGVYTLDEVIVDQLYANLLMQPPTSKPTNSQGMVLPVINAAKIRILNSVFGYADSIGRQVVNAEIKQFELTGGSVNLNKEVVSIDVLAIAESQFRYRKGEIKIADNNQVVLKTTTANNWKVSVKNIVLDNDSVAYQVGNTPDLKPGFNADHLEYNHIMLEASDLYYSADLTKVLVKKFSATDQNRFAINSFETDFSMDQHSVTAKKLKLKTPGTSVEAELNLQYASLQTLIDSMQFTNIDLRIKKVSFKNSDVLYFNPDLVRQPFFKNSGNVTTISGTINGPLNHLEGKNLEIQTGEKTIIQSDFTLSGLPRYQTAVYDFPNLTIRSGQKDIRMLGGPSVPETVGLPDAINMKIAFKGRIKSFATTVSMNSSFGNAELAATVDPSENFSTTICLDSFNLGKLLKDTLLYGPITLKAEGIGQGLELSTIKAKVKGEASALYLNQYTYHNLKLDGTVTAKQFEGKINANDENIVFDFDGLVNLNPDHEQYKLILNVKGADLQKLHLSKKDLRLAFVASADLKGGSVTKMNGTVGITNIIVASDAKKYLLESFLTASVNEPNKSEIKVSSALIDIKYSGTVSPAALPSLLNQFINKYFPVSETVAPTQEGSSSDFNFEIQLHNHPLLSKVLLPQLTEFEPGIIQGSFNSLKNDLQLKATIKKMVYGTIEVKDLAVDVNSDAKALNYKIAVANISNSQINVDNFLFDGKIAGNKIVSNLSSTDGENKKLLIQTQVVKENGNYKLTFDPKEFYLMNRPWNIAADNYIEFGNQGFLIHHLFIQQADRQINIESLNNRFNDDLNIAIHNFRLDDLSRIVEKDTSLVKGSLDGNILFKRANNSYGIVADAKLSNLIVKDVPIGDLTLKAANTASNRFDIDLKLSGPENNMSTNGFFVPNGGNNSISIQTNIQSLSMKTVQAFSMGQITEATGALTGNILVDGRTDSPDITGEVVFSNAFVKPAFLNNLLELKHETIQLKKDGIYFNTFTLLDKTQHPATINGSVQMKQFSDFKFDLQINTEDFLLFNTTVKEAKDFFGRMVIDSKIDVNGPMSLPVVRAKVKMKKGSNFTFAVPEDKLTTDKGEDVVEFDNSLKFNPILYRGEKKKEQVSGMTGIDLSSIIEIDPQATLRLLMDPTSTDSLVVKGDAALSFTMDRSGKMSLTGAYNLIDGSYLVSLESVIKKKFAIKAGSTIIWNGDPLDAEISIDAIYSVRAAPYDLVADQISGLSDVDRGGYKQRYPFEVNLKLRGQILHPVISFEIQLAPEDKGILGGAVNQKLGMLNEDASALNKQVFALLVLGRFVQENPFQSESGGTSTLIRSTVGKFLSAQLNQLSSKVLPGVELNFDIQSYDDYETGVAKGRTQVEIGVKKQLFNERLSVQLGGTVDVEGDRAKQNSASDITSDVTVEYKLNKDGSFRMKGFRHNQYEGAIEGQLVETGVGVVFVRDFNRWRRLFKKNQKPPKSPQGGLQEDASQ